VADAHSRTLTGSARVIVYRGTLIRLTSDDWYRVNRHVDHAIWVNGLKGARSCIPLQTEEDERQFMRLGFGGELAFAKLIHAPWVPTEFETRKQPDVLHFRVRSSSHKSPSLLIHDKDPLGTFVLMQLVGMPESVDAVYKLLGQYEHTGVLDLKTAKTYTSNKALSWFISQEELTDVEVTL